MNTIISTSLVPGTSLVAGSGRDFFTEEKEKGHANTDAAYLRESILDPSAKIVAGYQRGEYAMPSEAGALTASRRSSRSSLSSRR